ncbi:MAG: leucyl aminopeptidase [Blastocatellia bacterium]|nr:leucyl aminopeptidase [Blastocatellia bacterium]
MDYSVWSCTVMDATADVVAIPVFECDSVSEGLLANLNEATGGLLADVVGTDEMRGKAGDMAFVHVLKGLKTKRLLLVGVGNFDEFSTLAARRFGGSAARTARKKGAKTLALALRSELDPMVSAKATVEGIVMGLFEMDAYKTADKEDRVFTEISLIVPEKDREAAEKGLQAGRIVGESVNVTRMLSNEPGLQLTPSGLAARAQAVAEEFGLEFDALDEARMQEMGMGAILGVSRGSDEEARMIVLRYTAPNADEHTETVALIGKGLTFDTGGISLKPAEGMEKMKYDMSGGSAVIGAMRALAQLKPKVNVIGMIASAENMPSGKAIKPGDILHSMEGKTIEVLNTDAEGRLVLADALAYARQLGATCMVDLATLTGAISIALGTVYTGLFTSDQEWADQVLAAAKRADEKMWQMPLDPEYSKLLKSDIADLKNIGNKYGGSITAAAFLKEFVADTPWVHLDIAGTGWNLDNRPYHAKGPSGSGVRTLVELVMGM